MNTAVLKLRSILTDRDYVIQEDLTERIVDGFPFNVICRCNNVFKARLEFLNEPWCPKCDKLLTGRFVFTAMTYGLTHDNFKITQGLTITAINETKKLAIIYKDRRFDLTSADTVTFRPDDTDGWFLDDIDNAIRSYYAEYRNEFMEMIDDLAKQNYKLFVVSHNHFDNDISVGVMEIIEKLYSTKISQKFIDSYPTLCNILIPVRTSKMSRPFKTILDMCNIRKGACSNITTYKNTKSRHNITCTFGHKWSVTYHNLIYNKSWCPTCGAERCISENKILQVVSELFPQHQFTKLRPSWLIYKHGKPLELDIYNDDLKLAIEYNGIQHYEFVPMMHKNVETFEQQQERDKFKADMCEKKGIHLISIHYSLMKKGDRPIRKHVFDKVKDYVYYIPLSDWFDRIIPIIETDRTRTRTDQLHEYIKNHASEYKLKDPKKVIGTIRDKFVLICPKGHDWITYYENLTGCANRPGRRCGECFGKRLGKIPDIEAEISGYWPYIEFNSIDYTGVDY
jgi:thiol-disulfide isomerase/thioredoxin